MKFKPGRKKYIIGGSLILLLLIIVALVGYRYLFITTKPENIAITNLSDNSFTITWTTDSPTSGKVYYSEVEGFDVDGGNVHYAFDDRDHDLDANENVLPETTGSKYYVHHVTLDSLRPNTKYFISIDSGVGKYYPPDDYSSIKTTLPIEGEIPTIPEPAYGKVILPEETLFTKTDAILFMKIMNLDNGEESTLISTVVDKENESWYLDLNRALVKDGSKLFLKDQLYRGGEVFEYVEIEAGQLGRFSTSLGMGADAPTKPLLVDMNISEQEGGLHYLSNSVPKSLAMMWEMGISQTAGEKVALKQEETGLFTQQKNANTCSQQVGEVGCRGKYKDYSFPLNGSTCECIFLEPSDPGISEPSSCSCKEGSFLTPPDKPLYDGRLDEGESEEYIEEGFNIVKINKVYAVEEGSETIEYQFVEGVNFFGMDIQPVGSDQEMASDLIRHLNKEYGDKFLTLGMYESGKWELIGYRNGDIYGSEDFKIEPGKGYMVRVDEDVNVVLTGSQITETVNIDIKKGWNLLTPLGLVEGSTAESFISTMKDNNIEVEHVSQWVAEKSRFVGIQKEGEEIYGFNFELSPYKSYFIKVKDGEEKLAWNPDSDPVDDKKPPDIPPPEDPNPVDSPNYDPLLGQPGPAPIGSGIWISKEEIMALPVSGAAWDNLKSDADESLSIPNLSNQDDNADVIILAKALVYARTGEVKYRNDVVNGIMSSIGTEDGGRTLALGRNLAPIVIAADLVNLQADAARDADFKAWLTSVRTETLDGKTLITTHEDRPNNWGTHAGSSRAAVAAYLGDKTDLDRTANVLHGWLGNTTVYNDFSYGDLDWQCNPSQPVGINPKGCVRDGYSLDGVIPDDQRRAGGFSWPPPKENYVWEGLQGAVVQAEILYRAGYPVYEWEDKAFLRSVVWLHAKADFPAEGDDTWTPWIINYRYGSNFPAKTPSNHGKNMGYTDWTHAK